MRYAILLLTAALAGCGPQKLFYRDNTSYEQFEKDKQRCLYEAKLATANYGSSSPTPRTYGGAVGQGIAQGIGQASVQNELAIECMKTKGYVLR